MPLYLPLISNGSRQSVINYIKEKREQGPFTVIDIGGSMSSWSCDIISHLVDMNISDEAKKKYKCFKCDINYESEWDEVLKYVEDNGKFDFSICTHTMEDISCPKVVRDMLCKISKEGYVAFPSKYAEFSHVEHPQWMGYIHHRWIFTIKEETLWGYPKVGFIQCLEKFSKIGQKYNYDNSDLSFMWKDDFDFKIVNNDYLGPNRKAIVRYYQRGFSMDGF